MEQRLQKRSEQARMGKKKLLEKSLIKMELYRKRKSEQMELQKQEPIKWEQKIKQFKLI